MVDNPSPGTRERLLAAGRRAALDSGLRKVTVRGVCKEAGVNLGSFVYHFGQRDAFIAELIEHTYAPLLERIRQEFSMAAPPVERLRRMVLELCQFFSARGDVILRMWMDGYAGEAAAIDFMRKVGQRHPQLLLRCIREAQAQGELVPAPPRHVLMFLMTSVGLPVLLGRMRHDPRVRPNLLVRMVTRHGANPRDIEQRLDWALKGLQAQG